MRTSVILLLVMILSSFHPLKGQPAFDTLFNQSFTSQELLADFLILTHGLKKIHPGLYRYNSRSSMDELFSTLEMGLKEETTYKTFYSQIAELIAQIKCQHTFVIPEQAVLDDIISNGRFLPYSLIWEFDPARAYVGGDFSSWADLPIGTQLKTINGLSIEAIYERLITHLPSDGDILSNKQSRLVEGLEFQLWYFLLIDRPSSFKVEFITREGEALSREVEAVTMKEWVANYKKYIKIKDPDHQRLIDHYVALEKKNRKRPFRLEFLSKDIARLSILSMENPKKGIPFLARSFEKIRQKGIENLIIDVRRNGGGADELGCTLFSYLIDEPSIYFDSIYATLSDTPFLLQHTDKDSSWLEANLPSVYPIGDGKLATKAEANRCLLEQQPQADRFEGKVYVLMNGRSASATAEFTAAAHFHGLATFIGEESGGAYHGGNGGDFAMLKLPNTGITVQVPLATYVMNSTSSEFRRQGTVPDYQVTATLADFLELRDPQLEFALQLIEQTKSR